MIDLTKYISYAGSVDAALNALLPLIRPERQEEATELIEHVKEGVDVFLNN